jgi:hypothetical protein
VIISVRTLSDSGFLAVLETVELTEYDVELRLQLGDAPELNLGVRPQRFDGLLQVCDHLPGGSRTTFSAWPGQAGLAAASPRSGWSGFANQATFKGLPEGASVAHLDAANVVNDSRQIKPWPNKLSNRNVRIA